MTREIIHGRRNEIIILEFKDLKIEVLSGLPQEKLNRLERVLKNYTSSHFSPQQLLEIIDAYEPSDQNALRASRKLLYCPGTILRCWRRAGFKIHKRGKGVDLKKYGQIKQLIGEGLNQSEVSRELEVTRQAISFYLKCHPELKEIYESERTRNILETHNQIKQLIESGFNQTKIAKEL